MIDSWVINQIPATQQIWSTGRVWRVNMSFSLVFHYTPDGYGLKKQQPQNKTLHKSTDSKVIWGW